jgi:hypothetical protein
MTALESEGDRLWVKLAKSKYCVSLLYNRVIGIRVRLMASWKLFSVV